MDRKSDLDAWLRFIVGVTLALLLVIIVTVVLYSLVFVTQPLDALGPGRQRVLQADHPAGHVHRGRAGWRHGKRQR
jgi:hypothetical protein